MICFVNVSFDEFLEKYCMKTEIPDVYLYNGQMYHVDELVGRYEMINVDYDDDDEKSEYWWMNY